ncbi:response regulator [Rhodocytophaga rosea]|uniref:Response regulator n=1 Tax=Rhodocytophaga rosea TaxID=2704465 RepID=A0A6C0GMX2_9BACT|nr:response regulator [Rhodocytophaga rosea]QHT69401.1 response regulator [Rhodocytophaga rosea]
MVTPLATYKIFLVDDDETFLMILRRHLELQKKFEVHVFNSGEDCLEKLDLQPDIIILDYNLNRSGSLLNGKQVLSEVLKQKKRPKIIMLSGQEDGQLVYELVKMGVQDYVLKGANALEELDELISGYIAR